MPDQMPLFRSALLSDSFIQESEGADDGPTAAGG